MNYIFYKLFNNDNVKKITKLTKKIIILKSLQVYHYVF